ncbi:MAG: Uma2 family endonuclease [Planctomycetota bacterium]|nr:Uma2 family endonuclease [Planctomycetota bacterium]
MTTHERLLTVDDVLSDPKYERGELWDGAFVVREPSGGAHGAIAASVAVHLRRCEALWRSARVLGSSTGYVVGRQPDRVLSPDASVLSRVRYPKMPRVEFIEGAPEMAVEIRSPKESWISVVEKGGVWIGHGARLVWCIDPSSRTVVAMRPGFEPEPHDGDAELSLDPICNDTISVRAIFEEMR